jgi:hypothetical protein
LPLVGQAKPAEAPGLLQELDHSGIFTGSIVRYGRWSSMNHFTNRAGFNAIGSQTDWSFRASQPPADHPKGAYFTTLAPQAPNLAVRLRIPREKLEFVFQFYDAGDLRPLDGGRGSYILYSPTDYLVAEGRQQHKGSTNL